MIATLSSFATQFDKDLLKKGKTLFDKAAIVSLADKDFNWQAEVMDTKKYKVTVRVEKARVTDVFCTCQPGVCSHIIAVMFAVREKLDIKTEVFSPELLAPEPHITLGNKLNNMVWTSRADDSKDGRLEKLGETLTVKDLETEKMFTRVRKELIGYDHHPIFEGAGKLLGAAILLYQKQDYDTMFEIADAIVTQISIMEVLSNSAYETVRASLEIMNELDRSTAVPTALKKEIYKWVVDATKDKIYRNFTDDLHELLDDIKKRKKAK